MKKIFMAIVAMTMLIATSCKKENVNAPENLVPGEGEFLVTIANAPRQNAPAAPSDGMTVKTTIENDKDIIWTIGDEISINGVEYKTEMDGTSVIFKSKGGAAAPDGDGKYKAYYPVDIAGGMFLNEFAYDGENLKNLPMYAESKSNVLTFNNICAALKITVPVACNKIVISANENLAGKFSIGYDATTSAPMAVLSTDEVFAELMSKEITVTGIFTANDAPVYVAIPAGTYNNFTVQFINDDNTLRQRTIRNALTLKVNNLYNLTFDDKVRDDEFCFTAHGSCKLQSGGNYQYYTSGMDDWATFTYNGVQLTAGQKVYFKAAQAQGGNSNFYVNEGSGKLTVSGNIMYLLDPTGNLTNFTDANTDAFIGLFGSMPNLVDASGLILPATTLASGCYQRMFEGCTSLTAAPNLPATTLAYGCYWSMFKGCSSLTAAPSLPATTLANNCYYFMFTGCTSLTTAPDLPATTLTEGCYNSMFSSCSALTGAPDLHATTLAASCYDDMFNGCSSLGVSTTPITGAKTFVVPNTTMDAYVWGSSMFSGTVGGIYTPSNVAGTTYYFYDASSQH